MVKIVIEFIIGLVVVAVYGLVLAAFGIGIHILLGVPEPMARFLTCVLALILFVAGVEIKEARNRKGSHG